MSGATEVPKKIFEAVKGKDIDIILNMGNGYVWTINGKDITTPKDVNFNVKTASEQRIPIDVINMVTGEKLQLFLSFDGDFGLKATLTIDLKKSNSGYFANLFYYNPTTQKLEYVSSGEIGADGKADLDFTHASDYVIMISDEIVTDLTAGEAESEAQTDGNPPTGRSFPAMAGVMAIVFAAVLLRRKNVGR